MFTLSYVHQAGGAVRPDAATAAGGGRSGSSFNAVADHLHLSRWLSPVQCWQRPFQAILSIAEAAQYFEKKITPSPFARKGTVRSGCWPRAPPLVSAFVGAFPYDHRSTSVAALGGQCGSVAAHGGRTFAPVARPQRRRRATGEPRQNEMQPGQPPVGRRRALAGGASVNVARVMLTVARTPRHGCACSRGCASAAGYAGYRRRPFGSRQPPGGISILASELRTGYHQLKSERTIGYERYRAAFPFRGHHATPTSSAE